MNREKKAKERRADKLLQKIKYLSFFIKQDMMQPLRYLIVACSIGMVFLMLLKMFDMLFPQGKEFHRKKYIWTLILIYAIVFINVGFFSREPGTRTDVSLKLFETWGNSMIAHAYFVENIIMFIPYGVLLPIAFKRIRKIWMCVGSACLISCMLEVMQHMTGRGYAQIDDVMTNTAGAALGYMVWKIFDKLRLVFFRKP